MVLVAVDALCPFSEIKKLSVMPDEVSYNNTLACFKVHSGDLPRRRPASCINKHSKVGDIVISDFCLLSLSVFCVFVFLTVNLKKIIHVFKYCFCLPNKYLFLIESFIYPTDAQLDCSKNVKFYMKGVATCFSFSQPSSGSYCMCFAEVISINNQLKYVIYRICSV
jgi:hypothetical protein